MLVNQPSLTHPVVDALSHCASGSWTGRFVTRSQASVPTFHASGHLVAWNIGAGDEVDHEHRLVLVARRVSRYSHVRTDGKRRALDEIAARRRAADEKRQNDANGAAYTICDLWSLARSSGLESKR